MQPSRNHYRSKAAEQAAAGGSAGAGSAEGSEDTTMDGATEDFAALVKAQRAKIGRMERADQGLRDIVGHIIWDARLDDEKSILAKMQQQSREA